ncbi:glycoside hydrolase family 3 N-terminal domain-containing protein [Alteromonas sp. M12]|uniref:beta-glucosidase n=1 Tax=Alteromonas sp. M12 TaxID=3135644 RepID=UPI00319E1329
MNEIIDALTLLEKVKLIRGTGMDLSALESNAPTVGMVIDERVPGAAGNTHAIPRLGIPSIVLADGPAGLRIAPTREGVDDTFYCTAFPIASLLASTWDTDLVKQVGAAMGHEVKEYGVDVLLAPALNIHRYPLGGRNFEYYSEDPYISGSMAAAMVNGIQSHDVGTSIKHYVANNHEWNRNRINVKVDERALREIYLKGFEITVKESQPWTVMSSYNKVNGTYTSESERLLTEVLREQWGYQGVVMTDWFGGTDPVAQMNAGNDLLMPGTDEQEQAIIAAVKSGQLAESVLDRNVRNILSIVLKSSVYKGYQHSNQPDLEGNAKIARMAASEGMVLLQNQDATLPLSIHKEVAVFGNSSYEIHTGGTGSGDVNAAYSISLQQGLDDVNLDVHKGLAKKYIDYINSEKSKLPTRKGIAAFLPETPINEYGVDENTLQTLSQTNDAAIITIGRSSGEFVDRQAKDDFYLSDDEQKLINGVSKAFHAMNKKVVVILNVGGVIETASWRDKVDAILLAWQPGQEAGHAIADVLIGKVNPSGKLTTTFSLRLEDGLPAQNFPGVVTDGSNELKDIMGNQPSEITYKDGIFVGYRDFNTNHKAVAYPFGFGLSYSEFSYSKLNLSHTIFTDEIDASITIKNEGKVSGREVVQLYITAPKGVLAKPSEELRHFAKTKLLAPGESQAISFTITTKDLVSYNPELSKWVADAGDYQIKLGASSRDFRQMATFTKEQSSQLPL